jgi:hypothetical protein
MTPVPARLPGYHASVDADERLSRLEAKLEAYDAIISKLRAYAALSATGRALLKILGLR